MVNMVNGSFHSPDLSLAAFLVICAFTVEVDKSGYPYQFTVKPASEKESEELDERVKQWRMGVAMGNCAAYFQAYKRLQQQVVKNGND